MACFSWSVEKPKMIGNGDVTMQFNVKPSADPDKFSPGEIAEIRQSLIEEISKQLGVSKCIISFTNLILLAPEEETSASVPA